MNDIADPDEDGAPVPRRSRWWLRLVVWGLFLLYLLLMLAQLAMW